MNCEEMKLWLAKGYKIDIKPNWKMRRSEEKEEKSRTLKQKQKSTKSCKNDHRRTMKNGYVRGKKLISLLPLLIKKQFRYRYLVTKVNKKSVLKHEN